MNHRSRITIALCLLMSIPQLGLAEEEVVAVVSSVRPGGTIHKSLQNEVDAAIMRSLDWLAAQQKESGAWSSEQFPALTGLGLWAFANSQHPKRDDVVKKAVGFIESCIQADGGIYREVPGRQGGGLGNYNTAICMTALHKLKDPKFVPIVQKAREYVAKGQHLGGDVYDGGFGYDQDNNRAYADLLNTYYAVIAMRETADVEDLRPSGEKRVDIDWSKTVEFIVRMQNSDGTGKENAGGFFYKPGQSKAGTTTNDQGTVIFRSYGSMTYAGLLALIYADVAKTDTRVRSAFDWSRNHWQLDENPGMGAQGHYYFFNVLTKALDAYGQNKFMIKGKGAPISWREEIAKEVVSRQKVDPKLGGYWVNNAGRFWENDPVLTTAYMLITLQAL